jgi:hypothetical protein
MGRAWVAHIVRASCLLPVMAALACPVTRAATSDVAPARCYDAVVVARLIGQEAFDVEIESDEIIFIRSPWIMTFEPKKVLYAAVPLPKRAIKVGTVQHTAFRDEITYFLVFLRQEQGRFRAQWIDTRLTRDAEGRFVRPLDEEEEERDVDTFPQYWIPSDYRSLQVALRFRTKDAWWLRLDYDDDGNLIPLSSKPKWTEQPALRLEDLRSVFERQASQPCPDSPYQAG